MSVADDIKSKLDIVTYIQRTTPLKRAGRVYKACCPFHNERTPSFVVNPDTQSWRCFGACAEGGDVFKFAMKQNGWTFREALEELGRMVGVEVRQQTPEQKSRDEASDRLRGLVKLAAEYYHERLLDASDADAAATLEYALHRRGLTLETIKKFQIGYAPNRWDGLMRYLIDFGSSENDLIVAGLIKRNDQGRVYDAFRNRLMIPIRDERGRPVGFGARALAAEDNPKYLNSPQSPIFDKSRLLFALNLAAPAIRSSEQVVIVEGYLDAIQAHQAGYTNVVAQMGTAFTEHQLRLVAPRWAHKIILALDADAAGQNATRRSLEVARTTLENDLTGKLGVEFRVLHVPNAKDPDDFIREQSGDWPSLIDEAMPVADFVIGMEMATLPPNASIQEREAAAMRLLPLLSASEDDLYRGSNIQRLAMKLRLPERDMLMWAAEHQKARQARPPRPAPAEPKQPVTTGPDDAYMEYRDEDAYDDFTPYVEVGSSIESTATPAVPVLPTRPRPAPTEIDMEAYCLRALFEQPGNYYAVNRRMRELAEDDATLQSGPLGDFCAEDFTRTAHQELMRQFMGALQQDEFEFIDYLRHNLDENLAHELVAIMHTREQSFALHLHQRQLGDLERVLALTERQTALLDHSAELIEKALRLREKRLARERQEIVYLLMEGMTNETGSLMTHATNTLKAKERIDRAISGQTS